MNLIISLWVSGSLDTLWTPHAWLSCSLIDTPLRCSWHAEHWHRMTEITQNPWEAHILLPQLPESKFSGECWDSSCKCTPRWGLLVLVLNLYRLLRASREEVWEFCVLVSLLVLGCLGFFFPIYKTKIKARVGELNFSNKNHPEFWLYVRE